MSLRAILLLGPAFFRGLRKLPNLLYRAPKTYQVFRVPAVPNATPKGRNLIRLFGNFGNTESLVSFVRRTVSAASAHRRPNSLLRAYSGLAGSVHLRNQIITVPSHSYTTINKLSEPQKKSWFQNFISSFNRVPRLPSLADQPSPLSPKGLLGVGCNSAVWAADLTGLNGKNYELAVKVLYNYYASPSSTGGVSSVNHDTLNDSIVDWILLRRQLERECTLRPSSGHPNIVPIVGQFLGRTPASDTQPSPPENESITTLIDSTNVSESTGGSIAQADAPRKWMGANAFPEGFGGHSYTYYLLMPRFDATLGDFLGGRWCPPGSSHVSSDTTSDASASAFVGLSDSALGCLSPACTSPVEARQENHRLPMDVDDAVAISAQLFDAVAELEFHGVAHRDIKADNVLIRHRTIAPTMNPTQSADLPASTSGLEWLDDGEVLVTNTRFHVALTDFGCAVRTKASKSTPISSRLSEVFGRLLGPEDQDDIGSLAHSGNIALLAPEIAVALRDASFSLSGANYSKSDLWAMATLVYPLFGVRNPFIDSSLTTINYNESDLPSLPEETPGVVTWLLEQCLKRSPNARPSADLVADVLHTWCVLRHAHRRQKVMRMKQTTPRNDLFGEHDELFTLDMLDQLISDNADHMSPATATRLRALLDVSWASDWLTGPARPPDGLRVSFYRRVTLNRFAHCLRIVYQAESARAARRADQVSASLPSV